MLRLFAVLMVALLASAQTAPSAPTFAPGQEWSLRSDAPTTAKVVIGTVEPWRDRIAVSVSVIDLPVSSGASAPQIAGIDHMPFDRDALAASVDRLLRSDASPTAGFMAAHRYWRDVQGGIWTIQVQQAIVLARQTMGALAPPLHPTDGSNVLSP